LIEGAYQICRVRVLLLLLDSGFQSFDLNHAAERLGMGRKANGVPATGLTAAINAARSGEDGRIWVLHMWMLRDVRGDNVSGAVVPFNEALKLVSGSVLDTQVVFHTLIQISPFVVPLISHLDALADA